MNIALAVLEQGRGIDEASTARTNRSTGSGAYFAKSFFRASRSTSPFLMAW
ncbi:MAG: hypothetical protein NT023_05000 [Armatimonadetes bacterium]|nr:hypothetical protein [Armatimonadota bacterium]